MDDQIHPLEVFPSPQRDIQNYNYLESVHLIQEFSNEDKKVVDHIYISNIKNIYIFKVFKSLIVVPLHSN